MAVVRFYSDEVANGRALQRAAKLYPQLSISTELCYNVELTGEHDDDDDDDTNEVKMQRTWTGKQM